MRSHLLSVAALALLSVFVAVSTPCLAEGEQAASRNAPVIDPSQLLANSDPSQAIAPPDDTTDAAATIEEHVESEEVPSSEE